MKMHSFLGVQVIGSLIFYVSLWLSSCMFMLIYHISAGPSESSVSLPFNPFGAVEFCHENRKRWWHKQSKNAMICLIANVLPLAKILVCNKKSKRISTEGFLLYSVHRVSEQDDKWLIYII